MLVGTLSFHFLALDICTFFFVLMPVPVAAALSSFCHQTFIVVVGFLPPRLPSFSRGVRFPPLFCYAYLSSSDGLFSTACRLGPLILLFLSSCFLPCFAFFPFAVVLAPRFASALLFLRSPAARRFRARSRWKCSLWVRPPALRAGFLPRGGRTARPFCCHVRVVFFDAARPVLFV